MSKVFSFDAETDGLWGPAFAIAAAVYEGGERTGEFVARLPDTAVSNEWVSANVLPALAGVPVTHTSRVDMLRDFAAFYLAHKGGADVIVHMGTPVEAGVLIEMRREGFIGDWDGPFPLIDVAGVLTARGQDPTSVDKYRQANGLTAADDLGLTPHHPLYDSVAAAEAFQHLLKPAEPATTHHI